MELHSSFLQFILYPLCHIVLKKGEELEKPLEIERFVE